MSLHRLFWVPEGAPAKDGAYVRYPERELLGLLALESHRRRMVIVGEDLGTVPSGFSARLQARGLLSTRLLYFERDESGFRDARSYPRRALVAANTHDLAPLAGWCTGEDLGLRHRTGRFASDTAESDEALQAARREREEARIALERRLRVDGHLAPDETLGPETAAPATSAFLAETPAGLCGLSLDDLAGEHEPVNLPGVPETAHPSWTRRMRCNVEECFERSTARRSLEAMRRAGRTGEAAGPDLKPSTD